LHSSLGYLPPIEFEKLQSGPLGGDPLTAPPHDADVRTLLRIAVVWNIPVACNRVTADFMISSPLLAGAYRRAAPDYGDDTRRMDAA